MNILLTLDENYLLPCKVMLDSLFASNPAETDVTVYLLHSAIPAEKLEELASFCAALGAALRPIAVDAALFESAPTSKRYPKEMYYRLLSPLILPREVERVLYLDPDMLIINPLRPLWEMDLYGKPLQRRPTRGSPRWPTASIRCGWTRSTSISTPASCSST